MPIDYHASHWYGMRNDKEKNYFLVPKLSFHALFARLNPITG